MPPGERKRRTPPPAYKPAPNKQRKGGWLWVLLGMTLSIIGSGGAYLFQEYRNRITPPLNPADQNPAQPQPVIKENVSPRMEVPIPVVPPKNPPAEQNKPAEGTSFDFYKLLPEMQVGKPLEMAPDSPAPGKTPSKPTPKDITTKPVKTPETPPANVSYILQAGAFRSHQEADNLRARLTLLGLEPNIQTVDKLHRVRIGPFRNFQQATQIQQRLQKNGFSTILTKEPRG